MAINWLNDDQVCAKLGGIARVTLYRWRRRDPKFPRPAKPGGLKNLTPEHELDSYVEADRRRRSERRGRVMAPSLPVPCD
jgi:predicted DNA-binding transcriptional regulator AlpA